MASSSCFYDRNIWGRESERDGKRRALKTESEKPRGRRTNQSQTREGFGVSSGGSRHWVTGCVHPSLVASPLFTHRNSVREDSMCRS